MGNRHAAVTLAVLALALPALAVAAPDPGVEAPACAHGTAAGDALSHPCGGIRPGLRMTEPAGCTFNFVFRDDADRVFIGTAGHCVDAVGQSVSGEGVGAFGTVAFRVDAGEGSDFALVEVWPAFHAVVSPALCHWGGPTGGEPDSPARGDAVRQYGHGLVLGQNEVTRAREGTLVSWGNHSWKAVLPVTGGDSGSPLVFASGEAAGVVTHLSASVAIGSGAPAGAAVASAAGTRLARAVALAEAGMGVELTLVTAS